MKKGKLFRYVALVVSVMLLLCACGGGNKGEKESNVTLKWYLFTSSANSENEQAYENAAQLAKEKIGVNVEFIGLNSGSYSSKMQTLCASNEEFDIMFVSNWMNNYFQNVGKGALIPLDNLLEKEAPDLYKSVPDYWWEATKIDGKIYGVPNQQIAARAPVFSIPAQNIESMGMDLSSANVEIGDYKQLYDKIEEYLRAVKEKTGRYTFFQGQRWNECAYMYGLEELIGSNLPGAIRYNQKDGKIKVINQYEEEEFKYCIEKARQWVEEGLIQPNIIDPSEKRLNDYIGEGKVLPWIVASPSYTCYINRTLYNQNKVEFATYARTKALLATGGLCATLNGISVTSKNPDKAIKLLELANTDSEFFNAVAFGKEGIQYEKLGDNRIKKISEPAYNVYPWAVGNVFNGFIDENDDADVWEKTKEINANAVKSPLLGFSPNTDKLKIQIAGCQSAIDEYLTQLTAGVVETEPSYSDFIKKLKAADCDMIIEELQRQIDEWQKNK